MAVRHLEIPARALRFDALSAGDSSNELVLLLHGFPQSAECWRRWLAPLGDAGFHAVAPNLRGYSAGAMPEDVREYRVGESVADVIAMAAHFGAKRFHVVGHDWGGLVAWQLGQSHGTALRSLIAVSTPHPAALAARLRRADQGARLAYIPVLRTPRVAEILFALAGGRVAERMLVATGLPAVDAHRDVRHLSETGVTGALNWYRALELRRTPRLNRAVAVPAMFIWGDHDVAFGRAAAEATERYVDASYHFVELQGASHWIPDLHWDDVSDLVVAHLQENRAAA